LYSGYNLFSFPAETSSRVAAANVLVEVTSGSFKLGSLKLENQLEKLVLVLAQPFPKLVRRGEKAAVQVLSIISL